MIANMRARPVRRRAVIFFIVVPEHRLTAKQSAQSETAVSKASIIPIILRCQERQRYLYFQEKSIYL